MKGFAGGVEKNMNTGHKGDISELMVLTELLKAGRETAIPYGNRPGYDLLVLGRGPAWKRIQIKTAYLRGSRSGKVYCDFLRGSGSVKRRQYSAADLDHMICVLPCTGEYWVFDVADIEGKRCRSVSTMDDEYMDLERI